MELLQANQQLGTSKQLIEQQHIEITDSLNYARQIQEAILPGEEDIKLIFPNSFVLYLPKDLISGDFYWITQIGDKNIISVADGTGHGVPGGFLTMLGVSMLNELVLEQGCISPAEILQSLRAKLISSLKQTSQEGNHKDGLDMTIAVLDVQSLELTYATANQSLYIDMNGGLKQFKGDHIPVGLHGDQLQPFHEYKVQLEKGMFVYMLTDGFGDQFGGENNKKYKTKAIQHFLSGLKNQPSAERHQALTSEFYRWKGNHPQTDDVTLFGFEIQ